MSIQELLREGELSSAIDESLEFVRKSPFDIDARSMLVELLILDGQLERADKQLDVVAHQHPEAITGVSLLRQLIRAEISRSQYFAEGRVPELVSLPDDAVKGLIELSILLRDGDLKQVSNKNMETEEKRIEIKGTWGEEKFDDFRDLDDRTASIMEVLTSTGKYYWVPFSEIKKITFRDIERPLDYKWRRAFIETVNDGVEGEVFIPGLYFNNECENDALTNLGRKTEWLGENDGVYRGIGQRIFLIGDESYPINEIRELEFDHE